jgi:hypothetical protein
MPSVTDAPELIEYVETHDLTIETLERPQPRRATPGFWHSVAQKIARFFTTTPHTQHASACHTPRPFETPADQLARQCVFR